MKFLAITIYLLATLTTVGQNPFDIATVPEAVRKHASVIKRSETIVFEVADINSATTTVHQVLTVMSEAGNEALFFHQGTDKFHLLGDVDIRVYDASGKLLNKYKKKDLTTIAFSDGLVDDGKNHYFRITTPTYPVTVEYKFSMQYKGTLSYPAYRLITPGQGVENSTFIAKVPKELDLRYKEKNVKLAPVITEEGKYKIYKWAVTNLEPIIYEEGAVSFESRYPSILLAPNKFQLDDYEGDMTSWKNFGIWYKQLKKGVDVLPEERKVFFRQMVSEAKTEREKAKLIYEYLQANFRYVSIQLGIGGFKPFSADFTDKKKYGDCKALSNYMQSALDAVNIKSYVALINANSNKEPVDPDFPCNQFNHMILCVPLPKDTVWLECTSSTNDFAVLGSFTENRNALLIADEGGILVPTPSSRSTDNVFNAHTSIHLEAGGNGKTITNLRTSGEYKQDLINYLFDEKLDDQKSFIVNHLGFKLPDQFKVNKTNEGSDFHTNIELEIEKIPDFSAGSKMFLNPRVYQFWSSRLPKKENRKLDFYFECPFQKIDTTIIFLPEGYKVDAIPKEKQLKCSFANYATTYHFDEKQNAVISTATMTLAKHRIPAANYAEVKNFFDEVLLDDTQKIVIKKAL
jgi:hypothetical protein